MKQPLCSGYLPGSDQELSGTTVRSGSTLLSPMDSPGEDQAFPISDWHEVVVSVRDMDSNHEFSLDIAQRQVQSEGVVSRDQLSA